ncbi:restriction endonuclease subunit S [Vibrio sp. 10N.222.54.B12]|uniref:restriction endonuclease subunit S n=1 Tax=unclassified Vibrio TaxID=2614977 RepID=UPI00354D2DB9
MGSNWAKVSIESIKANEKGSIAIGPFGSRLKSDNYVSDGIPVIRGTNVTAGPTFKGDFVYITEDKADSLGACNVYKNELVFPHRGSIGEVGFVQEDKRYVLSSSLMKLKVDEEQVNPMFLYYFFKSSTGKHELLKNASQVGTPGIGQPLSSLKSIFFNKPPLVIQNKIVDVLSSVNNKLELNNQINQTLEQMAQTLFKSWFVDFAPVKAKMNGEQAKGMDAATASLFPEKLVESELGLIPEGWGVGELSKLFELHRGFDLPKSKRQDGEYPVYAAGGYHGTHNEFKMEPPGIITGRSGVIGNVYLSLDKYWPLNTTLYVREFRTCGPYYAYHLLRSLDLKSLNSGSAVPSLNRNFVHSTNVSHPDSDVLAKFEEIVTPLFEKMVANNEQNKSLSELRDTLLPKLLSGEIDLENVQVEQAKAIAE